jgi:primosomal protein N' (replication factor Y) (superfamily II helicase)
MTYLEVAVAVPLDQTLTYSMAEQVVDSEGQNLIGRRVLVPLGKRRATGYVVAIQPTVEPTEYHLKEILEFLDDSPIFHPDFVPFYRWVANYYHYPLGLVIKTALPGGLTVRGEKRLRRTAGTAALPAVMNGECPAWFAELTDKGELGPRQTARLLADKTTKKLIDSLVKNRHVALDTRLARDSVRAKSELCYSLTEGTPAPPANGDGGTESIKKYRQILLRAKGLAVSYAEARALDTLYRLNQEQPGEAISQKILRTGYGGSVKALAALSGKGLVTSRQVRIFRGPSGEQLPCYPRPERLSEEQAAVLSRVVPAIRDKTFTPFLLHGVTGCGKTEVYLRAAEETLAQGRDVLILVPEIALATQLEAHLLSRFADQVVLLHSGLSGAERFDQFTLALTGKARVVIGARSAIFAPLKDPGLIVVDEEHDPGFKQDDNFRYHGRDLAVLRARHHQSVVILGSATPSITSYAHAQSGKYVLLTMSERIGSSTMPSVTLVDLNGQASRHHKGIIHRELQDKLVKNLENRQQSILLLNRRGFSTVVICRDCGTPVQCSHCHVSLTLHKGKDRLICHYCGFTIPGKTVCLQCRSTDLVPAGFGTERVEEEVRELLPTARIIRLDSDTAGDRRKFLTTLAEMHSGKIDILIGTQMIAKGHHFPNVTLVGVVWADGGMSMPDFRAAERTFQLITQVTGRAGRGDQPGEVLIQTMRPNHYAIVYAREHQYGKMFNHEMRLRRHPLFPPYVRLTILRVQGRVEAEVQRATLGLARFCRKVAEKEKFRVETLGPAPSPLDKIKDTFRWQVLLKGVDTDELHAVCTAIKNEQQAVINPHCTLVIDVDPENMM